MVTLRKFAVKVYPYLWAVTLAAGLSVHRPSAADSDLENEHLAALVRQLETLDRLAAQSALASNTGNRYHFDYARLRQDVARIRTGIEEWASPDIPYLNEGGYPSARSIDSN